MIFKANSKELTNYLATLEDKEVEVKPYKKTRTNQQNRLYWLYLKLISKDTGDIPENLHAYFRRVLLKPKTVSVLNKTIKVPQSTTKLNKTEFSEYMAKIEQLTEIQVPNIENINQLDEYINY